MTTLLDAQRGSKLGLCGVCALAALLLTGPASANGRFPRAQRLIEDPREPAHLILGATYGLLTTEDGGGHWRYVCEAAYGVTDLTVDALTSLTADGVLLAGIYSGVSRAADSPCDFERTLGMNNREAVPDFAIASGNPGRVVAIQVSLPAVGSPYSQLYRSEDDGATWQPVGEHLPEVLRAPLTVDVAPSDSDRIYVSGLGAGDTGLLLRSDDGGQSFETFELPTDAAQYEYPYIAAVDPVDADRLYLRTDLWAFDAELGVANAGDALLYSDDAGQSFSELKRAGGKLLGFTFSPDGSELLIGYGDPLEAGGSRLTDPDALGIYRAPKGSSAFEHRYAGSVGCLTWTSEGLYVCTHEVDVGFSLGLTRVTDFTLDAAPELEPLLKLADVVGPIECDGCSAAAVCRNYWYSACLGWGRQDCVELEPSECRAEGGAPSGGAMAAGQGGAPPRAGEPPTPEGGAPAGATGSSNSPVHARGGCACQSTPADVRSVAPLVALLLAGLFRRRAR